MLSKPYHGWTDFKLEDIKISGISYLCNPHIDLCEALSTYLLSTSSYDSSVVAFDLEDKGIVYVVFNLAGVTIINDENAALYSNISLSQIVNGARELVNDIEENFNAWLNWSSVGEEDREAEKTILENALAQLRTAIARFEIEDEKESDDE